MNNPEVELRGILLIKPQKGCPKKQPLALKKLTKTKKL
jgi:hypothetical protein